MAGARALSRILTLAAALALAPGLACHRGGAAAARDAGAADGAAADTGAPDGGGGDSGGGGNFWSCGSAAGLCTCVRIDVDPGDSPHACPASDCCFVDRNGACSCRLPTAALACPALVSSLRGTVRVDACP